MLDTLTKFGGYRVDYFQQAENNPCAFAFYVRGGLTAGSRYSLEAKQQLYFGLAQIQSLLGLENLAGVYIDVNELDVLARPAYVQLKRDILENRVQRVLVLDRSALLGSPAADADMARLNRQVMDLDLFTIEAGKLQAIRIEPVFKALASLAV